MPINSDFIIPVDRAIKEFREHLKCHPRTILSARYGDGKTYFLDSFRKDKLVLKEFVFITLYPVNYQVLENHDIFDVIKYDILLQMGLNDMLDETIDISPSDAFFYCMQTKGLDFLGSLLDIASSIEGIPWMKAIGKIGTIATRLIKRFQDASEEYKRYAAGENSILSRYVAEMDKIPIYEEDPVTRIIQSALKTWRKKKGNGKKRVVLLIEDMDRIDPAHLFRILNIFSAHVDYTYKFGTPPNPNVGENKFGMDNVVMVVDYGNLRSIFSHFYGEDTCFEGYISKFADKGLFEYSLKAEAASYFYDTLSDKLQMSKELLKQVLQEDVIKQRTLRDLGNSIESFDTQCLPIVGAKENIPGLMVVLRRLGYRDNEICRLLRNAVFQKMNIWLPILYPSFSQFKKLDENNLQVYDSDGKPRGFFFSLQGDKIDLYTTNVFSDRETINLIHFFGEMLSSVVIR